MESSGQRSPPKAEVDDSPLHQAMDRNKESLKVKLMLRRPINQLVAQGIMPPLKTPPGFHEQRQKLERAKMGDLLRAKIQQRPDREELVRQHILEADVGHVDPSLAEKQRQLKKCRLADALNDQLSHRPGPLELIKKNILHTEEPIERAVKEGAIEFKATCEGASTKPPHPDHYMLDEDSSSLSPPPAVALPAVGSSEVSSSTTPSTASTPPSTASTPSSAGTVPPALVTVLLAPVTLPTPVYQVGLGLHLDHREVRPQSTTPKPVPQRKKSKVKTTPKARTIKFHEYKGPPNAQKNSTQNPSSVETSYELLLQQQQLFLQWQLEWQHKYPQILLPASQKPAVTPTSSASSTSGDVVPPPPPPLPQSPPPLRNLEDMKVSDLKAELKRRNLPVSGAKPQLIERLKPFSEPPHQLLTHHTEDSLPSVCSVSSSGQGGVSSSCSVAMEAETSPPPSPPTSTTMESSSSEDIIREQQRKIDQLERQLTLQLHSNTFQQQQPVQPAMSAKASLAAFLQQHQQQQHQLLSNNNNNNKEVAPLPGFVGTFIHSSGGPGDLPMEEGNEVKSQIVDDVLEILIKNGELPASAAAEPLSLDLELDSADLMEVDTAWLDSLELSPAPGQPAGPLGQPSLQPPSHRGGDPLIGGTPFDLFMDEDPDLKMAAVDWGSPDRIDFAI